MKWQDYVKILPENYQGTTSVECRCFYCSTYFKTTIYNLKQRMKSKWFPDRLSCKGCNSVKQADINQYRAEIGQSPATGHHVSEDQKKRWRKAVAKSGAIQRLAEERRGKTFRDLYGEERAEIILKKMSEGTKAVNARKGYSAHTGHTHSQSSREKMRISRLQWEKEHGNKKLYTSPLTGAKVTRKELIGDATQIWRQSLSPEQELAHKEKYLKSLLLRFSNPFKKHSRTGAIRHWDYKFPPQVYDSSLELVHFEFLNSKKKRWEKNKTIYVPYVDPDTGKRKHCIPDVLIYRRGKLVEIQEIKPFEFSENPFKKEERYYRITRAKLDATEIFCRQNNLLFTIVTEENYPTYYEKGKTGRYRPKKKEIESLLLLRTIKS